MHVVFLLMAERRITQTTPKWLHINPVSSFKHSKSTQLANIGQSGVNCNPICVHPSVRPHVFLSARLSFLSPLLSYTIGLSVCLFVCLLFCLAVRLFLLLSVYASTLIPPSC